MSFFEFAAMAKGIDNEQEKEDDSSDEQDDNAWFAVPEVPKKVGEVRVHRRNLHHVKAKTKSGVSKIFRLVLLFSGNRR